MINDHDTFYDTFYNSKLKYFTFDKSFCRNRWDSLWRVYPRAVPQYRTRN